MSSFDQCGVISGNWRYKSISLYSVRHPLQFLFLPGQYSGSLHLACSLAYSDPKSTKTKKNLLLLLSPNATTGRVARYIDITTSGRQERDRSPIFSIRVSPLAICSRSSDRTREYEKWRDRGPHCDLHSVCDLSDQIEREIRRNGERERSFCGLLPCIWRHFFLHASLNLQLFFLVLSMFQTRFVMWQFEWKAVTAWHVLQKKYNIFLPQNQANFIISCRSKEGPFFVPPTFLPLFISQFLPCSPRITHSIALLNQNQRGKNEQRCEKDGGVGTHVRGTVFPTLSYRPKGPKGLIAEKLRNA